MKLSRNFDFRQFLQIEWQRTLVIVFIAQVVTAVGFSSIFPFLPLYVKSLGSSTNLGVEFLAGLVYSAQAFTMMIASPFWGALADRVGRKPMVERAMFGGAVLIFFMAFVQTAEQLNETYRRVFDEILELEWRCARVTPWFMAQEGLVGVSETENVGTVDYEAILPYSGSWLEFQNVSVAGNKYPRGFNVKIQSGGECWSGCSGIGLERWTAAFLAQKGFDSSHWPEEVVRRTGEIEEVFQFL